MRKRIAVDSADSTPAGEVPYTCSCGRRCEGHREACPNCGKHRPAAPCCGAAAELSLERTRHAATKQQAEQLKQLLQRCRAWLYPTTLEQLRRDVDEAVTK